MPRDTSSRGLTLGRYALYDEIASGGMAAVHLARQKGDGGFARTVAIKRLHSHLARDPEFVARFIDEARLAARIRHPNVVPTLDVTSLADELFLVMEYVPGESLVRLLATAAGRERVPVDIAIAIIVGVLHGLQAAHEATNERGEPLHLVHRDVSPQNVLVGADGVARILDFGIAKAVGRLQTTAHGRVQGKAPYMAPEQLAGKRVDARTDVYAASVLLWETLTAERLFEGDSPEATMNQVFEREVPPPSAVNPLVPAELDAYVLRGLSRIADDRFASAREMAIALENVVTPATPRAVGEWVHRLVGARLRERAAAVASIEQEPTADVAPASAPAITTPARDTPVRRSSRLLYAVIAAVGLVIVATTLRATSLRNAPLPDTRGSWTAPPPPATPPPSEAAPPLPPPSTSAATVRPPTAEPPPIRSEKTRPKAPNRPTTKKQCDPAYTLDKDGFRVPKPECL